MGYDEFMKEQEAVKEMQEVTYESCMEACSLWIAKYKKLRQDKNHWDYHAFQEVRDELTETMADFGPIYAEMRALAEQSEVDRKLYYEERKKHHLTKFGSQRGAVGKAEAEALLDCKDHYGRENEAKKNYYKAKTLVDRVDNMTNSIAGRCKGLLKDWSE